MDVREAKSLLRERLREARRARDDASRTAVARALVAPALAACDGVAVVAAYASFGTEPGTGPLRAALRERGVRVLLPVVRGDDLGWADDIDVEPAGERGLPEPAGPVVGSGATGLLSLGVGVLLMPALAVSADGVRLGKGGGFYDRLLADLPPAPRGPLRLAVVHADEVLPDLPAEPHDLHARVDAALTPSS